MKSLRLSAIVLALILGISFGGRAQEQTEVTLIAPGGIRGGYPATHPGLSKRRNGIHVKATFASGGATTQQVVQGGAFDVPVLQEPYQKVSCLGQRHYRKRKAAGKRVCRRRSAKGRAQTGHFQVAGSREANLLAAKSIAYPNAAGGAAAGVSFNETMKKLGIFDQMQPKIKNAQGGAGAMGLVAKGDVEIGLTFLSEMTDPGIDVVGPLPRDISTPTALVGFISAHAINPAAAKELLDYLRSPEAAAVYKAHRMQPGR